MTRIYLDVCCLNRPFDDQTHDRIHLEAEAVLLILTHIEAGEWQWIGSEVMGFEIDQALDPDRKHRVKLILAHVDHSIEVNQAEIDRAKKLEALGFHAYDALHLACAESGGAELFLTTDDRLLRLASRLSGQLGVRVENPLTWLKEVTEK